jgi:hypothetical protein
MNKRGTNQIIFITISLILIAGAGIGGYFLGQNITLNSLYPEPKEIFSIYGQITSIDGNSLVVETNSLERNLPGQDEIKFSTITVIINDQTKIYESTFSLENPSEFSENILSFSDLSVGDFIGASSDENIKGKTQMIATEIILHISASNSVEEFPESA